MVAAEVTKVWAMQWEGLDDQSEVLGRRVKGIGGTFLCSEGSRVPRSGVQPCTTARSKPGARLQIGLQTSQRSGQRKALSVTTHVIKRCNKN